MLLRAPALLAAPLVALASSAGDAPAQAVLWEFPGTANQDSLGFSVAGGKDLDGDGTPDLLLGAPQDALLNDSSPGGARIFSGASGALLHVFNGVGATDLFGRVVAGVGDVDGDGAGDAIVGAASADPNGVGSAGQARVFSGASGGILHDFFGPSPGSFAGKSVAGAGDVDLDGVPDILVGTQGTVVVFSGATGLPIHTIVGTNNFGVAVESAGNVDGDAHPDILVGATLAGVGFVHVYSGATGALLYTVTGGSSLATFGVALAGIGDVTGDGLDDFAAGGPIHIGLNGQSGIVIVFSGANGATVHTLVGQFVTGFLFGKYGDSIDGLGDVDGDAVPDFVAGAPGSGHAVVTSGATGTTIHLLGPSGGGFGDSVAGVGDVDGDGIPDVLVGSSGSADAAILHSGATGLPFLTVTGSSNFGEAVAGLGDVDGDMVPDFIVGDSSAPAAGPGKPGEARALSGRTGAPIRTFTGIGTNDRFGFAVALLDDVTGDGLAEIVVGAPNADPAGISNAGEVRLFSGGTGALLQTQSATTANRRLGFAVSTIPDANGDGLPELLAGAIGVSDVLVVSGANAAPWITLSSSGPGFGAAIAPAGDVDGDGLPDAIVGSPAANNQGLLGVAGRAEVLSVATGTILRTFDGVSGSGEELGTSVAGGIDVSGDGVPDLFAGAPKADFGGMTNPGLVRVFSGASGAVLGTLFGSTDRGFFGFAMANAGDADGDGTADLLVGAPSTDLGGPAFPGEAFLYSGSTAALLSAFDGATFYDRLGRSVGGAGDVNGDGLADVVVGVPGENPGTTDRGGAARVFAGGNALPGVAPFGSGCEGPSGLSPLAGATGGPPTTGNAAFTIVLSNAPAASSALLVVGTSSTSWLGIPLPLDLGVLGLAGCSLLVSGDILLFAATTVAGTSAIPIPIPADPALVGGLVFYQWYVVDPGPLPLPGAMSPALQTQVL